MKRSTSVAFGLFLAACSQGAPALDRDGEAQVDGNGAALAPPAPGAPSAPAGEGTEVDEQNDVFEFAYKWPAAVNGIPLLRAMLEADRDAARAALRKDAEAWKQEADAEGIPFNPYSLGTAWAVVADTPAFLSLSATISSYTGGAHGNSGFNALLWDKAADVRRKPVDLFDAARLKAAIQPAFCDAIDAQRAEKRGEKVVRSSGEMFDECIDPLEQTLILGSSNGKAFDRLGVLVGPYAAGPYAEGDYEVTLPVTSAVLAAVKPDYKGAFAAGR